MSRLVYTGRFIETISLPMCQFDNDFPLPDLTHFGFLYSLVCFTEQNKYFAMVLRQIQFLFGNEQGTNLGR